MKFFITLVLLSSVAHAASTSSNRILPVTKEDEAIRQEKMKAAKAKAQGKIPGKAEEDCDDKAKKPIEIKEETISLSGNTGCSLDEAH